MNIPMTPLSEAWNTQKFKTHSTNKYSMPKVQQEVLLQGGHQLNTENIPKGADSFISVPQTVHSHNTSKPSIEEHSLSQTDEERTVVLKNNKVLEMLTPYTDTHIARLIEKLLADHFDDPPVVQRVETFVDQLSKDDTTVTIAFILLLLYAIDILVKHRS